MKQIVEKVKLLEHLLDLMLDGRLEGSSLLTTLQVLTRLYRKVKA